MSIGVEEGSGECDDPPPETEPTRAEVRDLAARLFAMVGRMGSSTASSPLRGADFMQAAGPSTSRNRLRSEIHVVGQEPGIRIPPRRRAIPVYEEEVYRRTVEKEDEEGDRGEPERHSRNQRETRQESSSWHELWENSRGTGREVQQRSKWAHLKLLGLQERLEYPEVTTEISETRGKAATIDLKVSSVFTGDPATGSTLQIYWTAISQYVDLYISQGWSLRTLFRRLHLTLGGEVAVFYAEVRTKILALPQWDEQGQVVMEGGRQMSCQDPVSLFFARLEEQYPTATPECMREYEHFRRKEHETSMGCVQRLRGLAQDLGYPDSPLLVEKYFEAQPLWMAEEAIRVAAPKGSGVWLQDAYEAVVTVEAVPTMGWQKVRRTIERARQDD